MAVAAPGAVDGPDVVEASLAHELEFSWVHSSWLALQRDLGTRLVPAITEAVVRLEELRAQAEVPAAPAPPPDTHSQPDLPAAELRQRLEASEQDRSRLAAEAAAARAQVAALRGSWSWRLAAPLRAGHKLLGLQRR
jgi:hypothetical protein